jgi:DNA polymerase III subunit gamma/tau
MTRRSIKQADKDPVPTGLPIHVKYRPSRLEDVVGQAPAVKSLKAALASNNMPHAFLFSGPAGTGKTTLSRIVASMLKANPANIIELDAATHNGIDDMREITAALKYQGFGDNPIKVIILDECHQLTKQAWQAILKSVEEPPPHVFFALCTTEPGKVPSTIASRCSVYNMQPVGRDDLLDLLEDVCKQEDFDCGPAILNKIVKACEGSPRRALTMLATVHACTDEQEVEILLQQPDENKEVIDLCRQLVSGRLDWKTLTATLKAMPEMPAESVRIVVANYLASCLMGAKSENEVTKFLDILHPFSKPFASSDKMAPLLLAFGQVLYP